jgi:putative NADPH-quinone reductase
MKKVLVINGHPNKESFCSALTKSYASRCLEAGNEVSVINLYELKFNLNLEMGYSRRQELEPDLKLAQQMILDAEHVVIIHPVWWGSVPALLKGFFDRTLLPGFAFKYKEKGPWWDKLLAGKTGHLIYTSDTPITIYKWFFGAPSVNQVKRRVLQFCGISPVKVTGIGPIRKSTEEFKSDWVNKVGVMGSSIK